MKLKHSVPKHQLQKKRLQVVLYPHYKSNPILLEHKHLLFSDTISGFKIKTAFVNNITRCFVSLKRSLKGLLYNFPTKIKLNSTPFVSKLRENYINNGNTNLKRSAESNLNLFYI